MQTAAELIEKMAEEAKSNSNEPRFVRTLGESDEVRQGDIYVHNHTGELPLSKPKLVASYQLAVGSSKGSRHVAVADEGGKLEVWDAPEGSSALLGPVVRSDKRFTVEHPEHAHISLPSGCYQVTYQRDFEAEEIARVAD